MCQVGVSNEGDCSSLAIRLSNDCKRVLNKTCTKARCHAVIDFDVKTSRFQALIQDDCLDRGGTSAKQAVFLQR